MNEQLLNPTYESTAFAGQRPVAEYFRQVFLWMAVGLAITAGTAYKVAATSALTKSIISNPAAFYILLFGSICILFSLRWVEGNLSAHATAVVFLLYSAINGLSFSVLFFAYTHKSISQVFAVAAVMFGSLAVYGFFTNRFLLGIGQLCFTGLVGLLVVSTVNFFLGNEALQWASSVVGVLIFSGFIVYDTSKLREYALANGSNTGDENVQKAAILGALKLYLDFVNLFLMLLRLLGRRR
ncbi:MAG TPA: Bax inhibitor-1/YccA family protein [Blastocatellia bacterium]|nr:Bax inhibitor-1/YccA family protein [Blastocatellia bacterium]